METNPFRCFLILRYYLCIAGINEIQFQSRTRNGPSFITNSVAKMNEYYLLNADFNKRRYTMCHEIGHGKYLGSVQQDSSFFKSSLRRTRTG